MLEMCIVCGEFGVLLVLFLGWYCVGVVKCIVVGWVVCVVCLMCGVV